MGLRTSSCSASCAFNGPLPAGLLLAAPTPGAWPLPLLPPASGSSLLTPAHGPAAWGSAAAVPPKPSAENPVPACAKAAAVRPALAWVGAAGAAKPGNAGAGPRAGAREPGGAKAAAAGVLWANSVSCILTSAAHLGCCCCCCGAKGPPMAPV